MYFLFLFYNPKGVLSEEKTRKNAPPIDKIGVSLPPSSKILRKSQNVILKVEITPSQSNSM